MQHIKCRCKHCHKTYSYCTYGNGPEYGTESGCSMEYCGECQTAINEALGKIDVKFKPKYKEIMPSLGLDKVMEDIKNKVLKEREDKAYFEFPSVICYSDDEGYDNVETYTHNGKTFRIEWNDKTPDDKHMFIRMEFDIKAKNFTGRHWEAETNEDTFSEHKSGRAMLERAMEKFKESIERAPFPVPSMSPTMCDLFFMDPILDWDVKTPESHMRMPRHELHTWKETKSGKHIRNLCMPNNGYVVSFDLAKKEVLKQLNDEVDYTLEVQKYDDEEWRTITKIEVK